MSSYLLSIPRIPPTSSSLSCNGPETVMQRAPVSVVQWFYLHLSRPPKAFAEPIPTEVWEFNNEYLKCQYKKHNIKKFDLNILVSLVLNIPYQFL